MRWLEALGCVAVMTGSAIVVDGRRDGPAPIRVWLHAHNCYPDRGAGADRLTRALAAARGTIAVEQDLVWDRARGTAVVAHEPDLAGTAPTLEDHFFRAVAPMLDHALAERDVRSWPRIVLHLDFKTHEPEHLAAVWTLLGKYERWLTTVPRNTSALPQPLRLGPLMVLTENGDGQERAFHDEVPAGERLRLFGTVPGPPVRDDLTPEARAEAAVTAPPDVLMPSGATNYRRWANFAWAVVERGGPPAAADWTAADRARLETLVRRAHGLGLWIRFYTLNGHAPGADGWSDGYNFGSAAAVEPRWRAAIGAGVDFIATDQYEAFSALRLGLSAARR